MYILNSQQKVSHPYSIYSQQNDRVILNYLTYHNPFSSLVTIKKLLVFLLIRFDTDSVNKFM